MVSESLAVEHHRLHVIEQWPDGPDKEASIEAVCSAINALVRLESPEAAHWSCIVCGSRGATSGGFKAAA